MKKKNYKKKLLKNGLDFKSKTNDIAYLTYMKHLSLKTLNKDSVALIFLDTLDMDTQSNQNLKTFNPDIFDTLSLLLNKNNSNSLEKLSSIKFSSFQLKEVLFNEYGFFNFVFNSQETKIILTTKSVNDFLCLEHLFNFEKIHSVENNPLVLFENFSNRNLHFDCFYIQKNQNNKIILSMTFIEPYDELKEETKRRIFSISFNTDFNISSYDD